MEQKKKYGLTIAACFMGYILQAVVVNVSPILFITLKEQFMLTYSQLGLLVLANFLTQLSCDLIFGGMLDRVGFRPFALSSAVLALGGFLLFAGSPVLLENPYPGFFIATVLFAIAGGLMEILLSPIINALPLPQEKKAPLMSFVHSAYSWGQFVVVLITTLLLFALKAANWQWILVFWCIMPVVVFCLFLRAPLEQGVSADKQQNARSIFFSRTFVLCMLVMISGGAGELIVGQWASSFIEKGLSVSKTVGDVLGVCAFALAMTAGRMWHSKFGENKDLYQILKAGLWLLLACYLLIGLAPGSVVPMIAIFLSGLGVALTWPGTLVVAAEKFPLAGSWMFAILAAGGDIGCSFGPWFSGKLMDVCGKVPAVQELAVFAGVPIEQMSLRLGMLAGVLFPILGLIALSRLQKKRR